MPISYEVDEAKSLLVMALVGEVSMLEITTFQKDLATDALTLACAKCLVDLELSIPVDGSPSWMRNIAGRNPTKTNLTKMAIVAPDDLRYGLSRAYQAYVNEVPYEIHVFKTRSEADDWLEL
jgi:hypothetical protein